MLRIAAFRSLSRVAVVIVCKPLVRDPSHLHRVLLWRTGAAQPLRLRNANGTGPRRPIGANGLYRRRKMSVAAGKRFATGIALFARLHHDLNRTWLNQCGPNPRDFHLALGVFRG